MKKFITRGIALAAAAMFLTGCGDGMPIMSEAEEAIVISYSAGVLAKRNRYQPEGLTAVYEGEEDEEEGSADTPNKPSKDTEAAESTEGEAEGAEGEGPDQAQEPEEPVDSVEPEEDPSAAESADTPQEPSDAAGVAEALGISDIQISYVDYFTSASYQQGEYFSLDAKPGNIFVILNFNVTNNTAEEVQCDIMGKKPVFALEINDNAGIRNQVTVLSNDMSTYQGAIGAGKTEAAILLFEVPEDTAASITSLGMSVLTDGEAKRLPLE